MDSWPAQLQQQLMADSTFQVTLGTTTIRSEVDVGPAKVRSRFSKGVDQYQGCIWLDMNDYSALTDFYKTTLSNGALPFLFIDPFSQTSQVFRFLTPPVGKAIGGRLFEIDLSLEKLP